MNPLELKVPPPLVALAVIGLMWALSHALPGVEILGRGRVPVALGLALLGVAFVATGALQFRRARTTVSPVRPDGASTLVTSGIYQVTRNPMYCGLMLVLLGWAVALASPISLLGPLAFFTYINRYQIRPEERILLGKFGGAYRDYMARVRRWV